MRFDSFAGGFNLSSQLSHKRVSPRKSAMVALFLQCDEYGDSFFMLPT